MTDLLFFDQVVPSTGPTDVIASHRQRNPVKNSNPTAEYLKQFSHNSRERERTANRSQLSTTIKTVAKKRKLPPSSSKAIPSRSQSVESWDDADGEAPVEDKKRKKKRDFDSAHMSFIDAMTDWWKICLLTNYAWPDLTLTETFLAQAVAHASEKMGKSPDDIELDVADAAAYVGSSPRLSQCHCQSLV